MSFLHNVLGQLVDFEELEKCASAFGQDDIGEAYIDYNEAIRAGVLIPVLMDTLMGEAIHSLDNPNDVDTDDLYQIDSNYGMWGINSKHSGNKIYDLDTLKADFESYLESLNA